MSCKPARTCWALLGWDWQNTRAVSPASAFCPTKKLFGLKDFVHITSLLQTVLLILNSISHTWARLHGFLLSEQDITRAKPKQVACACDVSGLAGFGSENALQSDACSVFSVKFLRHFPMSFLLQILVLLGYVMLAFLPLGLGIPFGHVLLQSISNCRPVGIQPFFPRRIIKGVEEMTALVLSIAFARSYKSLRWNRVWWQKPGLTIGVGDVPSNGRNRLSWAPTLAFMSPSQTTWCPLGLQARMVSKSFHQASISTVLLPDCGP